MAEDVEPPQPAEPVEPAEPASTELVAEDAPKTGPGSNRAANAIASAERHAMVISLRAQGMSWATVAFESGLSMGFAKAVWKRFVDEGKLTIQQTDPVAVVFEQISRLDADIETLALLSKNADNANAKVGAIRTKSELMKQQVVLLQAVGLMPKTLGKISVEVEQRYVIQQLMVFVNEFVDPDRLVDAENRLIELFRKPKPEELVEASAA